MSPLSSYSVLVAAIIAALVCMHSLASPVPPPAEDGLLQPCLRGAASGVATQMIAASLASTGSMETLSFASPDPINLR